MERVELIIHDESGKEVFRYWADATSITTNHISVPFAEHGVPYGTYYIAVVPYARSATTGELYATITEAEAWKNPIRVVYGTPEVPNTGGLFSILNISQKDFLISGLVIFGLVTAAGIVLMRRSSHRR